MTPDQMREALSFVQSWRHVARCVKAIDESPDHRHVAEDALAVVMSSGSDSERADVVAAIRVALVANAQRLQVALDAMGVTEVEA